MSFRQANHDTEVYSENTSSVEMPRKYFSEVNNPKPKQRSALSTLYSSTSNNNAIEVDQIAVNLKKKKFITVPSKKNPKVNVLQSKHDFDDAQQPCWDSMAEKQLMAGKNALESKCDQTSQNVMKDSLLPIWNVSKDSLAPSQKVLKDSTVPSLNVLKDLPVASVGVQQDSLAQNQIASKQPITINQGEVFSIYADECEESEAQVTLVSSLPDDVKKPLYVEMTNQSVCNPPQNSCMIHADMIHTNYHDSPMVLDDSLNEPKTIVLDQDDNHSMFTHSEYSEELFQYLRESEVKHKIREYIKKQPEISSNMRDVLVDWLVEVCEEYKLQTDTLYLAVLIVDKFLSRMSVARNKLQLVGTAAMFIATKFEEIYPPEICEFVFITDDTYSKNHILKMEQLVLKALNFELNIPTSYYFLHLLSTLCMVPEVAKHFAQYLCELALLDIETFLQFLPSVISCSAIWLANYTFGFEPWSSELERISKYKFGDFVACVKHLHASACKAKDHPQQAIQDKYKTTRFSEVARQNLPELTFESDGSSDSGMFMKNHAN